MTFDHELKKPKVSLIGTQILEMLIIPQDTNPKNCLTKWTPEYASYMVEGMHIIMHANYSIQQAFDCHFPTCQLHYVSLSVC